MGAAALIERAGQAGVRLSVADGKLIATPLAALSDELRAELRANKPELVAALSLPPITTPARTCTGCLHRHRPGTCGEPVAAGLTAKFKIVWPPEGYAQACQAFVGKALAKAPDRPYRLSKALGDAAHAEAWDDAQIATFTARVLSFMRRGIGATDADDLAERLHLRDVEGDHRRVCLECQHGRAARCPDGAPMPTGVLNRCGHFEGTA